MHPSRVIRGARSQRLAGRTILVGVSGSIAAVEVVKVIRELLRHGAEVRAVMSPEAARIITPEALEFATGHPPILQLSGAVEHVSLLGPGEGRADLYLIAPATANTIGKIAHGIDDTPVTTFASVALGGGVPVLVAPAMHAHMGRNPAVSENLALLRKWGVGVIASRAAEGEEKLASPEEIAAEVLRSIQRRVALNSPGDMAVVKLNPEVARFLYSDGAKNLEALESRLGVKFVLRSLDALGPEEVELAPVSAAASAGGAARLRAG